MVDVIGSVAISIAIIHCRLCSVAILFFCLWLTKFFGAGERRSSAEILGSVAIIKKTTATAIITIIFDLHESNRFVKRPKINLHEQKHWINIHMRSGTFTQDFEILELLNSRSRNSTMGVKVTEPEMMADKSAETPS